MTRASAPSAITTNCRPVNAAAAEDLQPPELVDLKWPLSRPPLLFETSLPGVFAIGDVRSGSVKRVAASVGEGSVCIRLVHKVLAE